MMYIDDSFIFSLLQRIYKYWVEVVKASLDLTGKILILIKEES